LIRKPGGRCPACQESVGQHVASARRREERIEKVVAVVGTVLVVACLGMTAGIGLVEGVAAYAGAGAFMFYLAKKTF